MPNTSTKMITRALDTGSVSIIDEKERRIKVSFSSETPYTRYDWDGPWIEVLGHAPDEIDFTRLATGGAPALYNHNSYSRENHVGVIEKAYLENGRGAAEIRISKRESVNELWGDILDKIVTGVSVGYEILEKKLVKQNDEGPDEYRVTRWHPMEISFVPLAADPTVGLGRSNLNQEDMAMANKIRQAEDEEAKKKADEETEVEAKAAEEETEEKATETEDEKMMDEDEEEKAEKNTAALEQRRILDIQSACRKFEVKPELETELIRTGASVKDAKLKILDNLERAQVPINSNTRVETGLSGKERFINDAAEAIVARAGFGKVGKDNHMRTFSLYELARRALEMSGQNINSLDKMSLVGRAFTQSTSDFGTLLENAMHKVLQAAYGTQTDTWSRFCATGSVSDFRAHNRYRVGSLANLTVVNELGEFNNISIPDGEKASVIAQTKGGIINLSRQAIINDDIGAFVGLAASLGRAARRTIETDVYALLALNSGLGPVLADGDTLFHANHGNIGTGSTLSVEGLEADRVLMATQLDVSGLDFLDLRPQSLVVPVGLGGTARVINDAQYDPDTANKLQRPNMVRGLFADIVDSPRLTGTRRYMFASAQEAPVIEVSFLDGNSEPFLESQEGFTVDGTSWKVRLDYGVNAVDYRGATTNAGA